MKKILFFASALAGLFLAGSCQREEFAPVEENGVVTFEVSIPQVMTKGVVDDGTLINKLVYDVYWTDASVETAPSADDLNLLYKGKADIAPNGATVISVELMNDKNYVILFWAQRDNTWGFATEGNLLKNGVNFPDSFAANAENIEAFSHVEFLSSKNLAARTKNITLKRPFAQINLGSVLADNFEIIPTTSSMIVKGAGASFDVINQVAVGKKDVEFTAATVPGGSLKTDYTYVGMNYIFANGTVEVDYTLNTTVDEAEITVTNTVSNVPVAANYRTNIIGKLFTSEAGYSITLEGWGDEGKDMEVITEGIVKNINGDYEISNENGLAYAMNNLMEQEGGNYYLTALRYEMDGIDVNPVDFNNVAGLYGGTPVVTRAATDGATGVVIVGLDFLINSIGADANVKITGVTLVNDNNDNVALVNNVAEGAEVVITDCAVGTTDNTSGDVSALIGTGSEHVTNYVDGYKQEGDGFYRNEQGNMMVTNSEALKTAAAVENAEVLVKAGTYTFAPKVEKGVTLNCEEGTTFKGVSNLNINGSKVIGADFWNIENATNVRQSTINGIFEKCSFTGLMGIYEAYAGETCKFIECHFCAPQYSSNFSGGYVEFEKCSFMGWSSFADSVTFNECTFDSEPGGRYNIVRVYSDSEFKNCEFIYGKIADEAICVDAAKNGKIVNFNHCTVTNATDEYDSIFNHFSNWSNGNAVTIDGAVYKKNGKLFTDEAGNYLIFRAAALKDLSTYVNERGSYFEGDTFKLGANIDLKDEEWVPIGSITQEHGFMGNFDGNGFVIKNLKMTQLPVAADGYVYAGLFGVTEGTDAQNQNSIKNLVIENVNIQTKGNIAAAAIAYPYYTAIENVTVKGNVTIKGGHYTAGVLAYTRRCVDATNIVIAANEGSYIEGDQTVGGVISDIQTNGGLIANYSNFKASGLTIKGVKSVGGISGIISEQTLDGATVEYVTLECEDKRTGIVAGAQGGRYTLKNVSYENVNGATRLVGATYDGAYYLGQILEINGVKAVVYTIEDGVKAVSVEETTLNGQTWQNAMDWAANLGEGWALASMEDLNAIYDARFELNIALKADSADNALFWEGDELYIKNGSVYYANYMSSTEVPYGESDANGNAYFANRVFFKQFNAKGYSDVLYSAFDCINKYAPLKDNHFARATILVRE